MNDSLKPFDSVEGMAIAIAEEIAREFDAAVQRALDAWEIPKEVALKLGHLQQFPADNGYVLYLYLADKLLLIDDVVFSKTEICVNTSNLITAKQTFKQMTPPDNRDWYKELM